MCCKNFIPGKPLLWVREKNRRGIGSRKLWKSPVKKAELFARLWLSLWEKNKKRQKWVHRNFSTNDCKVFGKHSKPFDKSRVFFSLSYGIHPTAWFSLGGWSRGVEEGRGGLKIQRIAVATYEGKVWWFSQRVFRLHRPHEVFESTGDKLVVSTNQQTNKPRNDSGFCWNMSLQIRYPNINSRRD